MLVCKQIYSLYADGFNLTWSMYYSLIKQALQFYFYQKSMFTSIMSKSCFYLSNLPTFFQDGVIKQIVVNI